MISSICSLSLSVTSLALQNLFSFMQHHLWMPANISWNMAACLRKSWPVHMSQNISPTFTLILSEFPVFHYTWRWFLCITKAKYLVTFFCMCISTFPSTTIEEAIFSPVCIFSHRWDGSSCLGLFLDLLFLALGPHICSCVNVVLFCYNFSVQ